MKFLKILIAGIGVIYMTGCGYVTSNYGASPDNVGSIRDLGYIKVSVNDFTSSTGSPRTSISCRAAGPISNKDSKSFEHYIRDAFVNDLKMAGVYAESAEISISGEISEVDFNSNIGAGKWIIKAKVQSSISEGYTVESLYEFSTNWVADKACQQVAQAFEPAVEDLIAKIVTHPGFRSLVIDDKI